MPVLSPKLAGKKGNMRPEVCTSLGSVGSGTVVSEALAMGLRSFSLWMGLYPWQGLCIHG